MESVGGLSMGNLKVAVTDKANPIGLAIEECMQKVMKIQGYDSPMEALQYMVEHLIAASAAVGIPPFLLLESCLGAIEAGTNPKTRGEIDKLFGEFQQKGH